MLSVALTVVTRKVWSVMTTIAIDRWSRAVAAGTLLAVAASAAAQDKPTQLLNVLEVRELVARAEPADHARLVGHFTALADRYAAQAARHAVMAHSFAGNPTRTAATGVREHCMRLADLNTKSAAAVRELATYHESRAAGEAATLPDGAAWFETGAGARQPTEREILTLAAKAKTPADHRGLQEYFLTLAERHRAEANQHRATAQTYRGTRIAQAAVHHDRLAALSRDAAEEATAAAAMHKTLADLPR